jgi:hypothetical protein
MRFRQTGEWHAPADRIGGYACVAGVPEVSPEMAFFPVPAPH